MKLAFFDDFKVGVVAGDSVVDVTDVVKDISRLGPQDVMRGVIERFDELEGKLAHAAAKGQGKPVARPSVSHRGTRRHESAPSGHRQGAFDRTRTDLLSGDRSHRVGAIRYPAACARSRAAKQRSARDAARTIQAWRMLPASSEKG